MTLLSLFMTSTGVFCFVPISHRLIECGIVPAPQDWLLQKLQASVRAPAFCNQNEDKLRHPLDPDDTAKAWSDPEELHQTQTAPLVPLYPAEDLFAADQGWSPAIVSPHQNSPTHSLSHPISINTFYDHEYTSPTSESNLCDNCNTLLQGEIPPDHIPSVIRALALFEAQNHLCDLGFSECDVVALTHAFSMLRL